MKWRIDIEGTDRHFEVGAGERVAITPDSDQAPLCIAVAADTQLDGLALIFASSRGVSTHGRPITCPVVAFDRRGGQVLVARHDEQFVLSIAMSDKPQRRAGRCLLCRCAFDGSPVWQCAVCGICFHSDCVENATNCPRCNAGIPHDAAKEERR